MLYVLDTHVLIWYFIGSKRLHKEIREKIDSIRNQSGRLLVPTIVLKKKLLSVKTGNYLKRLKAFENKHKMKSETFLKKFNAGKLGDDEEWFDWLFVYEAYNKTNFTNFE